MAQTTVIDFLKDLTKRDQIFRLTCDIANLHAVQGRNDGLTPLTHQAMAEIADTSHTEGTPAGKMASPIARRRGRTTNKTREVQTYRFERNADGKLIALEIGGAFGLFGKALRDAAASKGKAKYLDFMQSLALIEFRPVEGQGRYITVKAETTINAQDDLKSKTPLPRMEPRNSRGKERTMVPVFHERIAKPITVMVDMVINAECPRTQEELAGLLHAMQGVPFGPAKRGHLTISKVEQVQG